MKRFAIAFAGTLVALVLATPSHATLNACAAAKKACVSKKTAALLKCHVKAEKPPGGLDPQKFATCLQKAKDKFDGGANPAKGCFAKLEAKYPGGCLSMNDTAALEAKVDAYVDDIICALDPGAGTCPATPTPTPTSTPACNAIGQSCATNGQCCSLSCMFGVCQANCSNGMQDGGETGVDCGGPNCAACPLGGGCAGNNDCVNAICSGGTCVCGAGQSDCNGNVNDGCETTPASDPNNCGGCNQVCTIQNGSAACTASQCAVGSCGVGFADCNGQVPDGCETNTLADHNNCGFCGFVCGMAQTCIGGTCQ